MQRRQEEQHRIRVHGDDEQGEDGQGEQGAHLACELLGVGDGPTDLVLADFNADGREDFAVANHNAGTVSVRLGAGPAPLAGNLLVNGGFEQGLGAGVRHGLIRSRGNSRRAA